MRLFIGSLLFISLSVGALIYYQCAQNRQNEANVEQNQAIKTVVPPAVYQPNTQAEQANTYDASKDCLYRLYLFATIAGVCVALGGIYAIYKQTEATAQSAKAAADSVKLQEIGLKQWIELSHWQVELEALSRLNLTFQLVNPTKLPLTLDTVVITTKGPKTETIRAGSLLAPENPFVIKMKIDIDVFGYAELRSSGFSFGLVCAVRFTDCLEQYWEQTLGRIILCGPDAVKDVSSDLNFLRKAEPPAGD